jgi:hypothetical protein
MAKTFFRWKEPRSENSARRVFRTKGFFRLLLICALASTALVIGAYLMLSEKILTARLIEVQGVVLTVVIAIFLVYRICPMSIVITENRITRGLMNEAADVWKIKDIRQVRIESRTGNGTEERFLILESIKGGGYEIGLAPSVSAVELRAFFASKGVNVTGPSS